MSIPCGHKKNTETVAQYRKRCGGRPLGMIQKVSESDVKTIHNILTQHGKSASKATAMIKKNYRKVAKQFRGDSLRDLAIALIGYDVIGENKELFKMYKQAMKMMPGSPKQKELIKKISSLRKKLKMDEESKMSLKLEELVGKPITEAQFDEAAGKKDACYHKVKARYDVWPSAYASGALVKCRKVGAKNWGNKSKKESVSESYDIWNEDGSFGYTMTGIVEAEYQGRKVKLGKPMQGDAKKFKVYVKNDKGNVVKVNFGQGGDAKGGTMKIRKSNPKARKSFRARHNCDNPGPRWKARYWSCRKW